MLLIQRMKVFISNIYCPPSLPESYLKKYAVVNGEGTASLRLCLPLSATSWLRIRSWSRRPVHLRWYSAPDSNSNPDFQSKNLNMTFTSVTSK